MQVKIYIYLHIDFQYFAYVTDDTS